MKKLCSFIMSMILVLSASVPSFAQEIPSRNLQSPATTIVTENLGNGLTVETTTTVVNFQKSRSSSRSATRTKTYKANGSTVSNVTLKATFGYDGSSAWVSSKSASHTNVSGWSYGSQSLESNGDTADLSAILTQWSGIIPIQTVEVNISLTCSPNGQIS